MGSAFHQLCPRYSGTLTPTAPTAIRLWDTFTFFTFYIDLVSKYNVGLKTLLLQGLSEPDLVYKLRKIIG